MTLPVPRLYHRCGMTDRTIFESWNPDTQRSTELVIDTDGQSWITQTQNVKAILEANKRQSNNFQGPNKEGFTHIARVPMVTWAEWTRLGITKDQAALKAALEMRESMFLRTDDRRRI